MNEPAAIIIERGIMAALAAKVGNLAPVIGFLNPAPSGVYKCAPSTVVEVKVDKSNQHFDLSASDGPREWSVEVSLRVAVADDKSGGAFIAVYGAVDAALEGLTGDGCDALSDGAFVCDGFIQASTSSGYVEDDFKFKTVTFAASVTGHVVPATEVNE